MKLYYTPGACSLSPHIVLREIGAPFELEPVDLAQKRTESGEDYRRINPNGYVPALRLEDGAVLTEGAAIVQFLADREPQAGLAPPVGSVARAQVQAWLNFIAAELHKAFTPLFSDAAPQEAKASASGEVARRLDYVERELGDGRPYLTGAAFTIADAYLFAVVRWTPKTGFTLDRWPRLKVLVERVAERPAARAALAAEGLA